MLRLIISLFILSLAAPLQGAETKPFVRGSLAEIITQHSGKPFIVSYWSVDCPPCYKELRMWGELRQKYPTLPVVLVSTDAMEMLEVVNATRQEFGVSHLASCLLAVCRTARAVAF